MKSLGLSAEQLRQRAVTRAAKWNKEHPERRKEISHKSDTAHRDDKRDYGKWYRRTPKGRLMSLKHRLKSAFKMTVEQYNELLAKQGGVCAICEQPETHRTKLGHTSRLAVDHDHACCPGNNSCGKCVRALLCRSCNSALGLLAEDTERMRQMVRYVESFQLIKESAA